MIAALAATALTTQGAFAAMNFCAAPAMQNSERTNADPGVKALVKMVQSRLNDQPKRGQHFIQKARCRIRAFVTKAKKRKRISD